MSEETDNLSIWNALEKTDERFTRPITRPGGFKARAIDPVYNLKRVTEVLGPVGYAWGWHILNERLDTFGTGEDAVTIHSLTVRAWFRQDDGTVREVDQIGLTTVAQYNRPKDANEKRRFGVDEEYGKKSLTDALSKVMMSLGASSDVWMGRFDGNKYVPPEDWPALNGNGKAHEPEQRQTRQPQRQSPARSASQQDEVERALGAKVTPMQRPAEDTDPWKLGGIPAEHVAATIISAIKQKPWPEVQAAQKLYKGRLTLTEHEREQIRVAYDNREFSEQQIDLLAAG